VGKGVSATRGWRAGGIQKREAIKSLPLFFILGYNTAIKLQDKTGGKA
jgi:hypothetical protein